MAIYFKSQSYICTLSDSPWNPHLVLPLPALLNVFESHSALILQSWKSFLSALSVPSESSSIESQVLTGRCGKRWGAFNRWGVVAIIGLFLTIASTGSYSPQRAFICHDVLTKAKLMPVPWPWTSRMLSYCISFLIMLFIMLLIILECLIVVMGNRPKHFLLLFKTFHFW